jgi:dihydrofolate reductase
VPGRYTVEGHAILSADDRIADANGDKPKALQNDADWANFQAALDAAVAVVIGRASHEADPDRKQRNRVIVSSKANGLERRDDGWWWNPDAVGWRDMLAKVAPDGGRVAVPGGRRVFDLFLKEGMDEFHLARAHHAHLPGGVPVFSGVGDGKTAEECLAEAGFAPGETRDLDRDAGVTLTVWRRG